MVQERWNRVRTQYAVNRHPSANAYVFTCFLRKHEMAHPIGYLTRKETISCCHRLHSKDLSEADNKELYGKCNNFWGHGHNYTVEVTVRGPVNPTTGMVLNISELKSYMKKVLMEQLDHKNLDKDVPYFENVVSTTENLAIYIFNELKNIMLNPDLLYEVKIFETPNNIVVYKGE